MTLAEFCELSRRLGGCSPSRILIMERLVMVYPKGETMGTLAKLVSTTTAALTGIIDAMETAKLVSRGDHPTDRRVIVIKATERGIQRFHGKEATTQP